MAHAPLAAATSSSASPVIDISPYLNGSATDKKSVVQELEQACRSHGFLTIAGHGVSQDLISRMESVSRAFFDLPADIKEKSRSKDPKVYRGYFGVAAFGAAYSRDDRAAPPDYSERFLVGRTVDSTDPYFNTDRARRIFAPNIWPDQPEGFEHTWKQYYGAMDSLAKALLRICATALDLPEDWFANKFDKHNATFVAVNYPDQAKEPEPGQLRCGAHTDYGALTILKSEDRPGGLEVLTGGDSWEAVSITPGTFVVNLGDLMQLWTNDCWVSNLHRVSNPPRDAGVGTRRQSLVYFLHPNYDAVIECIPSCRQQGGAKYPPIVAIDHLMSKFAKMSDVANKSADSTSSARS
jgi:isopenicillin N synthase-like dioxygenase